MESGNASLNPVFYFPLELKGRDLDSRLLIAAHCLKQGYCALVGHHWGMCANITTAPRGQYLFKSMNAIQGGAMDLARNEGHLVSSTDEEALARTPHVLAQRISDKALDACHKFFAQSAVHKQAVLEKFPAINPADIVVTGNSRLDFLSLRARDALVQEAKELAARYGRFILINTNFTHTNSFWGSLNAVAGIAAHGGALNLTEQADVSYLEDYAAAEAEACRQIVALIRWISENLPGFRIILRPHPAERVDDWEKELADIAAVTVVGGSNPVPWLLAASLVIHTNCTTGLEAALLGRPAINLFPARAASWGGRLVMSDINVTFESWAEVAEALKGCSLEASRPFDAFGPKIAMLRNLYPDYLKCRASKAIADEMITLFKSRGITPQSPNAWRSGGVRWGVFQRDDVALRKFYLEPSELETRFHRASGLAEMRRKVEIAQLSESMFLLRPV